MELYKIYAGGIAVVFVLMTIVWALGARYRDASLVDRVWGLSFGCAMAAYLTVTSAIDQRAWVAFALVLVWGIRLSWHIHRRNRGHGEDPRYRAMRAKTGPSFVWKSLFTVNVLQGALVIVISAPLALIARGGGPSFPSAYDGLGLAIFITGFLFEAVGDAQLQKFRANPTNRGKVLQTGFWSLTRHPNYFGDALLWWGLWLIAAGLPGGYYSAIGPALMTFLLRRVSGVTLLESSLIHQKPGYAAYVASVPAFFPQLPFFQKKTKR